MSLIVTGTVGIDTIETPKGGRPEVLGGSCTYFAAAASFFAPVRLVAVVGDDCPDEHRGIFTRFAGIDVAGLEIRVGSKTFRWGGRYLDNMDDRETLFTDLGVLEETPPVVPEAYRDSKYVFLANSHPAIQKDMLDQLPQREIAVADTMNLWIDIARDELVALLADVDGLILNDSEAIQFTGEQNLIVAGEQMLAMGLTFVVIKKGQHGCLMLHRDGIAALPAYPAAKVIDPTGAGDSFAGGMMGWIAARQDTTFPTIQRALTAGTIIASFNIESFTLDRLLELTRDDVDARMAEFATICRV
jgi:sugar/nucleoside kinase (ribokinase family)